MKKNSRFREFFFACKDIVWIRARLYHRLIGAIFHRDPPVLRQPILAIEMNKANLQQPGHGSDKSPGCNTGPSRQNIWKMFDRVARRYDLLNHLLSANQDRSWRRKLAARLPEQSDLKILDLACGTGDQLLALYRTGKVSSGVGLDLAENMLEIGRAKIARRSLTDRLTLKKADAQKIPFEDNTFDVVSISFGIRNMTDVDTTLREMHRVLKPGGCALILEFSLPRNRLIRSAYLVYFRHLLPRLGRLISDDREAYRYLNETAETFPRDGAFCELMSRAGFRNTTFSALTFGVASIYRGNK